MSHQTHFHNIHFKMIGLVRRFSRRRTMSSSRIHCCNIIIGTEFKGKHILEQDELFCCAIISSGLKEKKIVLFSSLRTPDTSLFLPDPGFLSTCLGIGPLTSIWVPVYLDCGGMYGTTHTDKWVHVTPVKSEKKKSVNCSNVNFLFFLP